MGSLRCTLVCAGLCLAALALGNSHASTLAFTWLPGDLGSGWVGTARGTGAASAQQEYLRAMHALSGVFDGPPTFWGVVSDRNDTIAQMPFTGAWRGSAIAGLAVASVQGGESMIGVAFDDASLAPLTLDGLVRQVEQYVPLIAPPPLLQTTVWDSYRFPDSSGQVSLPSGWRLTAAAQGACDLVGPNGEQVALGVAWPVVNPQWAFGPMPGHIVAPYQDPVSAIQTIWPAVLQATGVSASVGRVLAYMGYPSLRGEQSAMILWEESWHGRPYLAYGYVETAQAGMNWLFYASSLRAPAEIFAIELPTMMAIWASREIDPQLHWQRVQHAMATLAEGSEILQRSLLDTSRRREAAMYDWAEVYRGTAVVRDSRTGEEVPANLAFVQETVDALNQAAGYAVYEHVPLREWWQGR